MDQVMLKKIMIIICAFMLGTVTFLASGCMAKDTLKVATNAAFAPFEYKVGSKFEGIDMDLARALAKELGMRIEIVNMEFPSVVTSVSSGSTDIALAALTVSEDRAAIVNFSNSYFNASQYIIVKSDNTSFDALTTAEEIDAAVNAMGANAKIGYQNATTGEYYANGDEGWGFDGFASAVKTGYSNGGLAVLDLLNGRINMVIIDEMPAKALIAANSGTKIINVPLTEEEYAIAVNKEKPELLEKINLALAKFMEDGTFDAIIAKYYKEA